MEGVNQVSTRFAPFFVLNSYSYRFIGYVFPKKKCNNSKRSLSRREVVMSLPFGGDSERLYPQIYPFRIENPYIWKKTPIFGKNYRFSLAYSFFLLTFAVIPQRIAFRDLGIIYKYCKHFTKIIPI